MAIGRYAPLPLAPILRPAARVILIDPADRVLLLRTEFTRRRLWITPGGGLEPGETAGECARRELLEETGIDADVGPCVWLRAHVFEFNGALLDEREQFFVVRLEDHTEPHDGRLLDHERDFIREYRWWSQAEIASSDDWFAPRRLAQLLPPILAGDYPREPIDCGV